MSACAAGSVGRQVDHVPVGVVNHDGQPHPLSELGDQLLVGHAGVVLILERVVEQTGNGLVLVTAGLENQRGSTQ